MASDTLDGLEEAIAQYDSARGRRDGEGSVVQAMSSGDAAPIAALASALRRVISSFTHTGTAAAYVGQTLQPNRGEITCSM